MTQNPQALLVIDVQNEYFTGRLPVTFPVGSLLAIGTPFNALDVLIAGIAMAYGPIK